jgi:hypothetical protein
MKKSTAVVAGSLKALSLTYYQDRKPKDSLTSDLAEHVFVPYLNEKLARDPDEACLLWSGLIRVSNVENHGSLITRLYKFAYLHPLKVRFQPK